ncbi:ankyrin repeat domain-containing protein [Inhella proteolytica]|uniref:Ankyrin repeat domain-containing protein n=1 Tax=Inhella proteolytica TaxID=2795029 RepID=A0A931NJV6_9BURK|nr:ankyrin repeat domain-containing protein [Inhella proteolytica]MBH9579050.1 ankyrin repeat domain-containing protein [Inhella proteolytica]
MSDPRRELPPELEGLDEWGQAYREQVQAEPEAARAARRARLLAALPAPQAQAEPVLQAAGPHPAPRGHGRSLLPLALGAGLLIGVLWVLAPWRAGAPAADWRLAEQKAPANRPEPASAVEIAQANVEPLPSAAPAERADAVRSGAEPAAGPTPPARSAEAQPEAFPAKPPVVAAVPAPVVEERPVVVAAAPPAVMAPPAPAAPAAQAGPAADQVAERVALAEPMAKKAEARDRQAPSIASTMPAPPPAARGDLGLAAGLASQPLDRPDAQGRTALMRAALLGHVDAVEALLRQGANPRLRDREGLDAAALAERAGHKALAVSLRAAVASAPQP